MKRAAGGWVILSVLVLACDGLDDPPDGAGAGAVQILATSCGHPPDRRPLSRFLDVNGDGFADAAIGAPGARSTFVYHGGPSGLVATPDVTLVGEQDAGAAVAPAGDVNGDGIGDLIVGSGVGTATVYLGTAGGINPSGIALDPGTSLRFGAGVATAGDVNGDRFDDVIVGTRFGAFVYLGQAGGINPVAAFLLTGPGSAALTVAGGMDFNRDGFGDVAVGSGNFGVAVYMGGPAGLPGPPALTIVGAGGTAAAGDVNGDRYSDLLVATGNDTVAVHAGSPTGLGAVPIATLTGEGGAAIGDGFGATLSRAGDVNGDGFDDLLVGKAYENRAYLFFGRRGGPAALPVATLTGDAGTDFGAAVAGIGDSNGDGFSDVIVGARLAGQAFLFLGAAGSFSTTPALTFSGPATFGESIARAAR